MSSPSARKKRDLSVAIPKWLDLPADYRHAYMQLVQGAALIENDLRAEALRPEVGRVEQAVYIEPRGLLARLFEVFAGKSPAARLSLVPPFDSAGKDAHGLFAASADIPRLEMHGAAVGQVRRIRGRLMPLDSNLPPDKVIIRDFWQHLPPAMHACEALDVLICPDEGPAVVLSFNMAPLVVGRPDNATMAAFLSRVGPRMRALLRETDIRRPQRAVGQIVELTEGQYVEALFVVRAEVRGTQEFTLGGQRRSLPIELLQNEGGPYRGTSNLRVILGGDAPGMRAVVRVG